MNDFAKKKSREKSFFVEFKKTSHGTNIVVYNSKYSNLIDS